MQNSQHKLIVVYDTDVSYTYKAQKLEVYEHSNKDMLKVVELNETIDKSELYAEDDFIKIKYKYICKTNTKTEIIFSTKEVLGYGVWDGKELLITVFNPKNRTKVTNEVNRRLSNKPKVK